jgi:hypothetical protein
MVKRISAPLWSFTWTLPYLNRALGPNKRQTSCQDHSIRHLVGLSRPCLKRFFRVDILALLYLYSSIFKRRADLAIECNIVEANICRSIAAVGEHDAGYPCPPNGAEAHRARLTARIDHSSLQRMAALRPTRISDRVDFGMCGRVAVRHHPVFSFTKHATVQDDDGSKWTASLLYGFTRKLDRATHMDVRHLTCPLPHAMVWTMPPSTRRAAPLVAEASFEAT